jgi:hypothetical protein
MVWFVDPSEPAIQGIVDVPEFNESLRPPQLFLVKDNTTRYGMIPVPNSTPIA